MRIQFLNMLVIAGLTLNGCKGEDDVSSPKSAAGTTRIEALSLTEPTSKIGLPDRTSDMPTGSQFLAFTAGMRKEQREEAIYGEIKRGNVPEFLRKLVPVKVEGRNSHGDPMSATVWVMPDYLAIGSDDDFVRIPMNLVTAVRLADELGFALPTRKLVNAIHAQASAKLTPRPLPPGTSMVSNEYYSKHNQLIERDLSGKVKLGELISGHKKDVVINAKMHERPDRIFIYGWLQQNGKPIQPLSDVHEATYVDYSHGIRLIGRMVTIDGQNDYLPRAIADHEIGSLFTLDGPIDDYQVLLTPGRLLALERR